MTRVGQQRHKKINKVIMGRMNRIDECDIRFGQVQQAGVFIAECYFCSKPLSVTSKSVLLGDGASMLLVECVNTNKLSVSFWFPFLFTRSAQWV